MVDLTKLPLYAPTAKDAIGAIVAAEGDLDLAAERLFGPPQHHELHPKAKLIAVLSEDPNAFHELQRQLRTLALLQTYNSTRLVGVIVDGSLEQQQLSDVVKLYTSLISAVATLTDEHTQTINSNSARLDVTQVLLKQLPQDVRESVEYLMLDSAAAEAPRAS